MFAGGAHLARERYRLVPDGEAVRTLCGRFTHAYYASCLAVAPGLTREAACWLRLHALQSDEVWIGAGPLATAGGVVKIVAAGSVALRRTLASVRTILHEAVGRREPSLRRAS